MTDPNTVLSTAEVVIIIVLAIALVVTSIIWPPQDITR